ncbi:MAG TPA: helix-turn-helix domain-containing protein [Nitrosomonas sp.]|nr:helix-turn-helix domain-containing protein [Nitrosomonas sp.]HMW21002.1 helix-turn-helix domain-containing protein [Nitrosomonas sp.]HMW69888.1 helix-turn-helix domain-containing protein [Nitrosomonas sp.]HMY62168.1 helix-turn-helix domain-containing protein [Nitrosomonas sp.]HNH69718.1 helix-turn-helix domain-containing protein [Nitrosomonas sp.]
MASKRNKESIRHGGVTMAQYENSTIIQRKRILDFLRTRPLDTLTARKELDIMHPAARVMELRKQGLDIKTIKIDRQSDCGEIHRVACYVLEVRAAATAPTDKEDGIPRQETDNLKHNMGVSL